MKLNLKFLGWLALAVLTVAVISNVIIHRATSAVVRSQTGFDLTFDRIKVGLFRPSLEITELKLFNPPDYAERPAVYIRRAYVRYSPMVLFGRDTHLHEVVLDMPRVVVVRKADGETNLSRLGKSVRPADVGIASATPVDWKASDEKKPPRPLRIDKLTVKLGDAQLIVHSPRGGAARFRSIEMNIERTYQNVTDLNQVALRLVAEIVANETVEVVNKVSTKLQRSGDMEKLGKGTRKLGNKLNTKLKRTKLED
ncbi:MAG: AsmA family protein [Verrucomicrobia bacterium]|nr:AsmA family protein [Verrucomicrobiota bacterium]